MVGARATLRNLGVLYERDARGVLRAIEVVAAPRWTEALLDPPNAEAADVRVVLLATGRAPDDLPPWLGVETVPSSPSRVAEDLEGGPGLYSRPTGAPLHEARARSLGRRLIPFGRAPADLEFGDFLEAGAAAVRHPAPVPVEASRRSEVLREFARRRTGALHGLSELSGEAFEWALLRRFATPDALADAVLLQRVEEAAPDVAAVLRALRDAQIAEGSPHTAELALDRRALLVLASPWRFIEGADLTPAVASVRAWLRRYQREHDAHVASTRSRARQLLAEVERELPAVRALERLDSIGGLGPALGARATVALRTLRAALASFESTGLPSAVGVEPSAFAEVAPAIAAVRAALEVQRQRLAAAMVSIILDQSGGPDVSRLLQAIQASDLDGIERALDPRLAAHIEVVLARRSPTPLAALAARYPEVDARNLEAVVAEFRELLGAAVLASPRGAVPLT